MAQQQAQEAEQAQQLAQQQAEQAQEAQQAEQTQQLAQQQTEQAQQQAEQAQEAEAEQTQQLAQQQAEQAQQQEVPQQDKSIITDMQLGDTKIPADVIQNIINTSDKSGSEIQQKIKEYNDDPSLLNTDLSSAKENKFTEVQQGISNLTEKDISKLSTDSGLNPDKLKQQLTILKEQPDILRKRLDAMVKLKKL